MSDSTRLDIGLEALNYQGPNGALAKELTEMFELVFDFKKKHNKLPNKLQVKAVRDFVMNQKFNSALAKVIEKNTGLTCKFTKKLHGVKWIARGPTYILSAKIGFDPQMVGENGLTDTIKYRADIPEDKEIQETLTKARNTLNKDTILLKDKKNLDPVISDVFGILACCDSLFLVDLFHEKARCPTASEITSGFLHEIGHVLSVVHYASTMHRSLGEVTQPIKISVKTQKDAQRAAKSIAVAIKRDSAKQGTSATSERDTKLVLELDDLLKDVPKFNLFKAAFCWIAETLYTVISFRSVFTRSFRMWSQTLLTEVSDAISYNKKLEAKDSDFKHSNKDITVIEFRADEFVATYGLGDALISFIENLKLNHLITSDSIHKATIAPTHPGQSLLVYHTQLITSIIMAPMLNISRAHGLDTTRYHNIQRDLIRQLRASNMHPEIIKDLLRQYENVQVMLKVIDKQPSRVKIHELSAKLYKTLVTVGGIGKLIMNRDSDTKYKELTEAAADLTNNNLVYYYNKLKAR